MSLLIVKKTTTSAGPSELADAKSRVLKLFHDSGKIICGISHGLFMQFLGSRIHRDSFSLNVVQTMLAAPSLGAS